MGPSLPDGRLPCHPRFLWRWYDSTETSVNRRPTPRNTATPRSPTPHPHVPLSSPPSPAAPRPLCALAIRIQCDIRTCYQHVSHRLCGTAQRSTYKHRRLFSTSTPRGSRRPCHHSSTVCRCLSSISPSNRNVFLPMICMSESEGSASSFVFRTSARFTPVSPAVSRVRKI